MQFMLIEDGQADVLQDGRVINTMSAGDCFGELAVLSDGKPRSASVVASTRVRAIVMTAHFTRELHRRIPDAASRIDAVAAERVERDAQRADAQG